MQEDAAEDLDAADTTPVKDDTDTGKILIDEIGDVMKGPETEPEEGMIEPNESEEESMTEAETQAVTENTVIKYVKEWDNWGSKDLDGLTVEDATLTFTVKKDVALNAEHIKFTLLGKTGELIGEAALMGDEEQPIEIKMKGNPVKNIYGGKVEVTLKGQNRDISKEQQIEISNLRVKIDGYYDKEF